MFGRYKYRVKANDEILYAAADVFGFDNVNNKNMLKYFVSNNAMRTAINALYGQAPPWGAAQAALMIQIYICKMSNDVNGVDKWEKILAALQKREADSHLS